jgi:hypothetical protein
MQGDLWAGLGDALDTNSKVVLGRGMCLVSATMALYSILLTKRNIIARSYRLP